MMINPRDPQVPGEYDLTRQRVNDVRDAARRVTMADGAEVELARGGLFGTRGVSVVVLAAVLGITLALVVPLWLAV